MKIAENEIHIWYTYDEEINPDFALTNYIRFLNPQELEQYQKLYFDKHKHQYLVTRALVRNVLSRYLQSIPAEDIEFITNDYKKPYVLPEQLAFPLRFNISHSDKIIVMAVSVGIEIGVDVEYLDRNNSAFEIAEQFFAENEYQHLQTLPDEQQKQRFFSLWTLKEAYIKACGKGLYIPLDEFWFSFPSVDTINIDFATSRSDDPVNWQFWQIQPGKQHLVSLAVKQSELHPQHLIMYKTTPLLGSEVVGYPVIASKC
ncbi:MAG: 4'-phosphopantetheinyl transferase superfamily protein [Reinekea sp.]|jgi:4'-phosphopantetheinyl transferase